MIWGNHPDDWILVQCQHLLLVKKYHFFAVMSPPMLEYVCIYIYYIILYYIILYYNYIIIILYYTILYYIIIILYICLLSCEWIIFGHIAKIQNPVYTQNWTQGQNVWHARVDFPSKNNGKKKKTEKAMMFASHTSNSSSTQKSRPKNTTSIQNQKDLVTSGNTLW